MPSVTMKDLLEAGVHFGHQTNHWNPRMRNYVFGARNGIYIIDLQQTVDKTKQACEFVKDVVSQGKKVLFVGTKKQAKSVIEEEAKRAGMLYVTNRWLGGMLTNYQTVKASVDRLKKLKTLMESEEWKEVPKKEQARYNRELEKLENSLGGVVEMKKLPGAVFIVDTIKEHIAVKEAKKLGIPTIAVVDTNCDPTDISYVIPGNDDALRSVSLFAKLVSDSCIEGDQIFNEKARAGAVKVDADESTEKKVSRFEGDVDLRGVDEADLEEQERLEEEKKLRAETTLAPDSGIKLVTSDETEAETDTKKES